MYTPKHNREEDINKLYAFMQEHSFATLVSAKENIPKATHLPFIIDIDNGLIKILGHMAKANDQWRDFEYVKDVLVIFQEPHAYISPKHYEKYLSVPTWNYVAVHAYGTIRLFETSTEKLRLIERVIQYYEAEFANRLNSYPEKFIDEKLNAIVAFEVSVNRLESRYKLSQDRTTIEQENIIRELEQTNDKLKTDIAKLMKNNLPK
ncbi:MAG: FMN-binding negative transcriptional regulator [Acidobacteriota bacterium]